jgi:hypothetical protein
MLSVMYAKCRKIRLYAECHYGECRGAVRMGLFKTKFQPNPTFLNRGRNYKNFYQQ